MSEFTVSVKAELSAAQFRTLHAIAERNNTTVGALVVELVRRGLQPKLRVHHGAVSKYSPELGHRILVLRALNRSYDEIAAEVGIAPGTARTYLRRAEAEKRAVVLAAKANGRNAA